MGFEICKAGGIDCRFATAAVDGADVVLADAGENARIVRYSWADSPTVNLVDDRMIPPPTFQMDVTPVSQAGD